MSAYRSKRNAPEANATALAPLHPAVVRRIILLHRLHQAITIVVVVATIPPPVTTTAIVLLVATNTTGTLVVTARRLVVLLAEVRRMTIAVPLPTTNDTTCVDLLRAEGATRLQTRI